MIAHHSPLVFMASCFYFERGLASLPISENSGR